MNKINIIQIKQEVIGAINNTITSINTPIDMAKFFQTYIGDFDREHFVVISLNVKNKINNVTTSHIGTLDSISISFREIFKSAILSNSSKIIISHNHPSGNVTPSPADIRMSKKLEEACEIMDIELMDHIIVSKNDYTSLRKEGYIGT